MTRGTPKPLACAILLLWALALASPLHAQFSLGSWVRSDKPHGGTLVMTIEACCNGGRRIVYRINGRSDVVMAIESPLDGSDAPVLVAGKPSGETMAIRRVDERHAVTVLKMNGKAFATTKSTLSADGKTLIVENEYTSEAGGHTVGKETETWVRK